MKNMMQDVRNHLVAQLEALGDRDADAETVERAKAASLVANSYIASVKVEIDAMRLADDIGRMPSALPDAPPRLRAIGGRS